MKTVIVIDNDDTAGMESTRRIVDHLMKTHHKIPYDSSDPFGSKIRTIKTMRSYVSWCKKNYGDDWEEAIGSLRSTKQYVETLDTKWNTKF